MKLFISSLMGLFNFNEQQKDLFVKEAFNIMLDEFALTDWTYLVTICSPCSDSFYIAELTTINQAQVFQNVEKFKMGLPQLIDAVKTDSKELNELAQTASYCYILKKDYHNMDWLRNTSKKFYLLLSLEKIEAREVEIQDYLNFCLYKYLELGYGNENDFKTEFLALSINQSSDSIND